MKDEMCGVCGIWMNGARHPECEAYTRLITTPPYDDRDPRFDFLGRGQVLRVGDWLRDCAGNWTIVVKKRSPNRGCQWSSPIARYAGGTKGYKYYPPERCDVHINDYLNQKDGSWEQVREGSALIGMSNVQWVARWVGR